MSWNLSVSARKADFIAALESAGPPEADLGDGDKSQMVCAKAFAAELLGTFDEDHGMVGLNVEGGAGASGLIAFSMSVASEPFPTDEPAPTPTEGIRVGGSRWAAGEKPEAPGTVDQSALEAQAAAEANDPTREAYQPDREPERPADQPTSLGAEQKATAETKRSARAHK